MVEMMGFSHGLKTIHRIVFRDALSNPFGPLQDFSPYRLAGPLKNGGDDGIRTHDPLLAGQVLSQLSYTPVVFIPHLFLLNEQSSSSKIEQQVQRFAPSRCGMRSA